MTRMRPSELRRLRLRLEAIPGASWDSEEAKYSVYVVQVENLKAYRPIDVYVGSTGKSAEARLLDHQTPTRTASVIFKSGRCRALCLRMDLMRHFPRFIDRDSAKLAEGEVSLFLQARIGMSVHSDALPK